MSLEASRKYTYSKKNKETEVPEEIKGANSFLRGMDWVYKNIILRFSKFTHILLIYFFITLIGALFLFAPFSQTGNEEVTFMDALFVSSSAFSDTGLTTVSISDAFNTFGQVVIFILIQFGGIGYFVLKIFLLTWILKKISFSRMQAVEEELGTQGKDLTIGVIRVAVVTTIVSTIIGGIIFGSLFATVPGTDGSQLVGNWGQAMWTGFFHASSSINNAGFDIFQGDTSMSNYYTNVGIQVLTMFLFILGGIGFQVIYDITKWMKFKSTGAPFKFSLLTKVSTISYFSIAFLGLFISYTTESINNLTNPDTAFLLNGAGTEAQRWWALTFNTFSTRNAGFSTTDISVFSEATKITWMSMMFIGSGPGSTAGGLRTTTLMVIILGIVALVKGRKNAAIFNRSISNDQVRAANSIAIFSFTILFVSILSIVAMESSSLQSGTVELGDLIFVTISAFGTTGLSTISLDTLSDGSQFMLIIIMFIGQIGIITLLKNFNFQKKKENSAKSDWYIEERINLGH